MERAKIGSDDDGDECESFQGKKKKVKEEKRSEEKDEGRKVGFIKNEF